MCKCVHNWVLGDCEMCSHKLAMGKSYKTVFKLEAANDPDDRVSLDHFLSGSWCYVSGSRFISTL